MSSRYLHSRGGDGQQDSVQARKPAKTLMTQDFLSAGGKRRSLELAAGLAQVNGKIIANALVDEKALAKKIDELSASNPVKSRRLRIAEKVDKIADPMLVAPIAIVSIILTVTNPILAFGVAGFGLLSLLSASTWASWVKARESPDVDGLEIAKEKLADAKDAKAALCARAGISERVIEALQALPLEEGRKHTVLRQAIFWEKPEEYAERVAGILNGIAARGEDVKEFAESRLDTLLRDVSQAQELAEEAEMCSSSRDDVQAAALFLDAARILEKVLDYAGAADMYKKASDASLANKKRAAELCAKSAECYLKAGNKASARERFEWAAMIVGNSDPGLSAELQGKAIALI